MHPEITFDAPLGWVRVRHERDFWVCDNGKRVVSRKQCPEFDDSGYTGSYAYPAGFKLFTSPKSGYRYLPYTPSWFLFLKDPRINAPWVAAKAIILNQGLFNTKPNRGRGFLDAQPIPDPPWAEPPRAECLTSTYAIHKGLERKNGSTRIETFKLSDPAPDPLIYNHTTTPWLFYPFMAIDDLGNLSYNWGNENHVPCISIDGSAWITDEKLEFLAEYPTAPPPEEPMPEPVKRTRAHGLDVHPKWQGIYTSDDIEEGFPPPAIIFQKAADGEFDYTEPGNYSYWLPQYLSFADEVPVLGGYHWFQTELPGKAQAVVALKIIRKRTVRRGRERKLYDVWAVDYEGYQNQINEDTAWELVAYVEHIRTEEPDAKLLLYINGSTYTFLRSVLGDWLDSIDIWFAGGPYYNQPLIEQIADDIYPKDSNGNPIPFEFWQYSADLNKAADENDFENGEEASIDVDVYEGTPAKLMLKYSDGIMDAVLKLGGYWKMRYWDRPRMV